jgi:cysteine-rich repeat protein
MKRFALPFARILGAASFSFMFSACFGEGSVCGDGVVAANEFCDDGNSDSEDFCNNECSSGPLLALEGFTQKIVDSTDVLLVVDNSGSMFEEHINFMSQLQNIIGDLDQAGKPLRFATITSDSEANPAGNFFTTPDDITLNNGALIRDIPNNFCDGVIANSNGGVLESDSVPLNEFIDTFGPIPDFTGRVLGFQDADGDHIADNLITPTFTDAVGCLLAVGIRGSGKEVALCQATAALDPASLLGSNSAFLRTPNSVLGIVVISDEDDCTSTLEENNGEITCTPALHDSVVGGLRCTQPESENICGTGVQGEAENLTPVSEFTDRIKALRDELHLYVATLAGPPAPPVVDCENLFPVPSCFNSTSGSASPGNRYFEFANQFANRSDAFENPICGEPTGTFSLVKKALVKTVDFDCLDTDIDGIFGGIQNFDVTKNLTVKLDLSATTATCESLGDIAIAGTGTCLLSPSAVLLNQKSSCGGGFELDTTNLNLPNGTRVDVEFRRF